ncbi:MAG: hypothetical protein FWF46_03735 [Oscillospiraceae bacterium]|nr:hypothetical protein [Oscillospiraceae bacterium]
MKEQKGITLIILVVTIILLLILMSISIPFSRKVIDDTKLNQFSSELQVIQKKLGVIADEISMGSNAYDKIGLKIVDPASTDFQNLSSNNQTTVTEAWQILQDPNLNISSDEMDNFVLLTADDLNTIGISKINQSVLVNYSTQQVVSFTGITVGGVTYYTY